MMTLMSQVVLLDYDAARETAEQIANEPKLGRPGPTETDTLNALLPSQFFDYQDELSEHAKAFTRAAIEKNDAAIAQTFRALAETCVACHSVYRNE